ncbi:hypothetical protein KBC03_03775 [Patescibacteria group bacterium]|nr:hypothetical protein [Patescibacteria group bacterium]
MCKKYYIHPMILELYESGKLEKHYKKHGKGEGTEKYEKVLAALLESL